MSNSSILPIDRTLWGSTPLGQSGSGYNGNKEVLCITGASGSNGLVSEPGHSLSGGGETYPSLKFLLVYSMAPTDREEILI